MQKWGQEEVEPDAAEPKEAEPEEAEPEEAEPEEAEPEEAERSGGRMRKTCGTKVGTSFVGPKRMLY